MSKNEIAILEKTVGLIIAIIGTNMIIEGINLAFTL